jgi:hypothetical protein
MNNKYTFVNEKIGVEVTIIAYDKNHAWRKLVVLIDPQGSGITNTLDTLSDFNIVEVWTMDYEYTTEQEDSDRDKYLENLYGEWSDEEW